MHKVFISSIVTGFEGYRKAARLAAELMGYKPLMCEDFGSKPCSSEVACIAEVDSCDIYVVILGEKYGFVGPTGESVTQLEYRAAKEAGKPILAFIHDSQMEDRQRDFRREVEDFTTGFFRDTFNSSEDLKDKIVKSLRQLNQAQQAIPEEEFKGRVTNAISEVTGYSSIQGPVLTLAFLPQPRRDFDIVSLEGRLDSVFSQLCAKGVLTMREGYSPECKRDWTGLKTRDATVAFFTDGMILLRLSPIVRRDDYFSSSFVPPTRIKVLALGAFSLVEVTGCWAHISLSGMDHVMVRELPEEKITSMTMRMNGDKDAGFEKFLIPFTLAAYSTWIDQCIKRFQRIFTA